MCAPPKIVSVDTKHAKIFIFSPQRVYKEMYLLSTQNAKNNTQNNASSRVKKAPPRGDDKGALFSLSLPLSPLEKEDTKRMCVCVWKKTLF